uniref:FAD/NAD(P)-binding domain-containing protein n=1 Tax=Panagrolaimus sp. PS1159 TaxID=55785 RepID=A0AC35FYW9_9BILA
MEFTPFPGITINEQNIVSSNGAFFLKQVPKKIIGLKLESVLQQLGAEVTAVEFLGHVGGKIDAERKKTVRATIVSVEGAKDRKKQDLECDVFFVAIGHSPYTKNLGHENIGLKTDECGRIQVNDRYQTSVPSVFAIDDVIQGPMLAHKAEEEGIICV